MNRKEYAARVAAYLKRTGVRKVVTLPKHTFHISDDDGNERDFTVSGSKKTCMYNADDIVEILDGFIAVALEALKNGETVGINRFGILRNKYRKERITHQIATREMHLVPPHLYPTFSPGQDLKTAVRLYEMNLIEKGEFPPDNGRTDFNVYHKGGDD